MTFKTPKDVLRKSLAVPVNFDPRSKEEILNERYDELAKVARERERHSNRRYKLMTLRSYAADPQHPLRERVRAYLHWLCESAIDFGLDLLLSVGIEWKR